MSEDQVLLDGERKHKKERIVQYEACKGCIANPGCRGHERIVRESQADSIKELSCHFSWDNFYALDKKDRRHLILYHPPHKQD